MHFKFGNVLTMETAFANDANHLKNRVYGGERPTFGDTSSGGINDATKCTCTVDSFDFPMKMKLLWEKKNASCCTERGPVLVRAGLQGRRGCEKVGYGAGGDGLKESLSPGPPGTAESEAAREGQRVAPSHSS